MLNREGEVSCEETALSDISPSGRVRIRLASSPVDLNDPFLYHKTTHRRLYQSARAAWPDYDDVLLWNQRGEITETTVANIVVERGGKLITPPLACGLLPGTVRGWLLAQGKIREGVITRGEAGASEKIFLINSVRGWRRADLELT